jgi:hypothetical protein|tara:strand:+ start:271 stop:519 length:249 start_codon:yes stop_codon:yes gene_type:complete
MTIRQSEKELSMDMIRLKLANGVYVIPCKSRDEYFRIESSSNQSGTWEIFKHATNESLGVVKGTMQHITGVILQNNFTLEDS